MCSLNNHGKLKRRRETSTKKLQALVLSFFVSREMRFLEIAHRVEKVLFSILKNMQIRMFNRKKISVGLRFFFI